MDLESYVQQAVELLGILTQEGEGDTKRPRVTSGMPGHEITQAAGVAFLFSIKAGLGLTASSGKGFVLAKVVGSPGWSAPLLFNATTGGLGISIGYAEVATLTILDTTAAVLEFLKTQVSLESHLSAAVGSRLAGDATEPAFDFKSPKQSLKKFSYSVNKGFMLDASWNGSGITVKDEDQAAIYGSEVTKSDILSGQVKAPPYVSQLYKVLNRLSFFGEHATDVVPGTPVGDMSNH